MGKGKGLLITLIIVVIVVVILAVGVGTVLSINNSTYDCSFVYVPTDDLINEIAKKHTYYDAIDKTVEIELNQDLINSLIKDNYESLGIALPDNFTIKEMLFNTKDQRLYINGKYGSINIPLSAKININVTEEGLDIDASDFNLGDKKAPGFIMNQIPQDSFKFSIKYEDLDLPSEITGLFSIKDIQFGSGNLKVFIQLNEDEIKKLALDYRDDLMETINSFKSEQSETIDLFITRLLDSTKLLTDEKVNEIVDFILNSEELVNSAIYFALAEDLDKYTEQFEIVQKAITDWAAPLSDIKYYGSIEETVDKVLYDEKLRELLAWFLPEDQIDEYIATIEEYYGMYEEYMGMYDDLLATMEDLQDTLGSISITSTEDIDTLVATLKDQIFENEDLKSILSQFVPESTFEDISGTIDDFVAMYHDYLQMFEDLQNNIAEAASGIDIDSFNTTFNDYTSITLEYVDQLDDLQEIAIDAVEQVDTQMIKDLVHFLEFGSTFGEEFISTIHPDNYATFRAVIDDLDDFKLATLDVLDIIDPNTIKEDVETNINIAQEWIDFADDVVSMLENKQVEDALDVLMNKDFEEMKFEPIRIPNFEEVGWTIEVEY